MNIILLPLLEVLNIALGMYVWAVIIYVVMNLLIAFQVINTRHPFVQAALGFLDRIIDPVLSPIRRKVPPMGSVDLSPLLLILAIYFVQGVLMRLHVALS